MDFRILGPLEVRENGGELALGGGRQRALLALLLLHANEVVATGRIVEELWGGRPPATATKPVQVCVSKLRKALGPAVVETRGHGYLLRAPRASLDLHRFEDSLAEGRRLLAEGAAAAAHDALEEGLALWRGRALAGLEDEPFVRDERARLEELRLVAVELCREARVALGRQLEAAAVRNDRSPVSPRAETLELPGDARKTVTVVFCDVVASTELAERLDPEAQRSLLGQFFDLAAAVLDRHGGTIEKFVGDAVLAVFGVPVVREDDALRAVRAAAELRETASLRLPELRLRIGVNTGEVVAGDAAAGSTFVTGEAVNAGKRLEEAAGAGQILLGRETHALVAHAVAGELLEPRELKGMQEPFAPFRLESVDPAAPPFLRRDDAPLVGRAAELARLQALYDEVAAGQGARLVTLVGDAGIGKSRLLRELLGTLGPGPTVLIGRCPPYGEGITFLPLRDLLRHAGIEEQELGSSSHAIFAAVRRLVEELAGPQPLVLAFEDVHWAEPTFLDLVEYLQGRLGAARVLLACLARPELAELRPGWLQEPAVAIGLAPLTQAESELLLDGLGAPAQARRRIADAAEGNPLFVEQLAALAEDDGPLPASIRAVLTERLDRLPREHRAVLERGAVAGRSFATEAVIELCPPGLGDEVHPRLQALVRARLLRPDRELPDGFRFQHALIRDAAYDGIPKAVRADLHERMAALVVGDGLVGFHLERAYRYREQLGRLDAAAYAQAAHAGQLLGRAGRQALARGDVPAAASLLERAIALVPEDDPARAGLLTELGAAQLKAGAFARAESALLDGAAAAARTGDRRTALRARLEHEFLRSFIDPDRVPQTAALLRELEQIGDELGIAKALWLASDVHVSACRWADRAAALEGALAHARRAPDVRDEAGMITALLAQALAYGPAPVRRVIARCEELLAGGGGDRPLRAALQSTLAGLHATQGEFEVARRLYADAVAVYDELGLRVRRLSRAIVGAQVESLAGDVDAAERELRSAYESLGPSGERGLRSTLAAFLADLVCGRCRDAEAERLADEARAGAAEHDVVAQLLSRSVRARVLARRGETGEAEVLAREAHRRACETDFVDLRGGVLLALGEVVESAGRSGEARELRREARALYRAKGNVVAAAAVAASLRPRQRIRVAPDVTLSADEEGL